MDRATSGISHALRALGEIFESGRPLSYIHSAEEQRISTLLCEAAGHFFSPPLAVWTWTLTEGLQHDAASAATSATAPGDETRSPRTALDYVAAYDGPAIFHFKDFHESMRESAEIRRRLRDLYGQCFGTDKYLIISSPVRYLPDELSRNVMYLELTVPDTTELLT